jgi:hypothetical protein
LEALAPRNPFAVALLAQLAASATRDGRQRLVRKTELVRRLYDWGYDQDDAARLFRVIEAMIALPRDLALAFDDELLQIEKETQMAYHTQNERIRYKRAKQEGLIQGLTQGQIQGQLNGAAEVLFTQITRKFGAVPAWASAQMSQADEAVLNRWALRILDAQRIEDVFI